jgi:nucleotide-binding universal stress UspA family protein
MKILVAFDNSDPSLKALGKAVDMAKKEKAELTLMNVYPDFPEDEGGLKRVSASMVKMAEETIARGKSEAEKAESLSQRLSRAGFLQRIISFNTLARTILI